MINHEMAQVRVLLAGATQHEGARMITDVKAKGKPIRGRLPRNPARWEALTQLLKQDVSMKFHINEMTKYR